MPSPQHIACFVDTGDAGREALRSGEALRGDGGARVSAVFVAPPEEVMRGGLTEWEVDAGDPHGPPRRWLEGLAAEAGAEPVLLVGDPPHAAALAWLADSDADLAVAAAHDGRVARALLGGFATELAYGAPVDTLILAPDAASGGVPVRRILCAVDGSPGSDNALRACAGMARVAGARAEVAHVVEPPLPGAKNLVADTLPMPAGRERDARALVDAALERLGLPGAEGVVLAGEAARALADRAEATGAELIVLGPRSGGRPGLGGVAARLVRRAPCAVLLARG